MIFRERPEDFKPWTEVVSCFCEHDGQILLLHRPAHKSQGNTWGAPGGKVDPGEQPLEAMVREIQEETSLTIQPADLNHFKTVYVRYPDGDFTYHMFATQLAERPTVTTNPAEHTEFTWVTPDQALTMPLILDLPECLEMYYHITAPQGAVTASRDL